MFGTILRLFLHYWHLVPAWLRYSIAGLVAAGAIVGWVVLAEAWAAWVLLILVAAFLALYGEPSEAEKKGYRF